MPFRGIANAEQLKVLTEVLDRHCAENHITDHEERMEVGHLIMSFYSSGLTDLDNMAKALDASSERLKRRA